MPGGLYCRFKAGKAVWSPRGLGLHGTRLRRVLNAAVLCPEPALKAHIRGRKQPQCWHDQQDVEVEAEVGGVDVGDFEGDMNHICCCRMVSTNKKEEGGWEARRGTNKYIKAAHDSRNIRLNAWKKEQVVLKAGVDGDVWEWEPKRQYRCKHTLPFLEYEFLRVRIFRLSYLFRVLRPLPRALQDSIVTFLVSECKRQTRIRAIGNCIGPLRPRPEAGKRR
ncbi:hypothetical protein ACRALDRAFT_206932 [Sodiomyces alcalophilus JCM 7366]|uniref:uncharacterized protein n=1 Tax=Sodiomyces alcalophilus JCM 7366 TaxID=591952 RepID=UPI0039B3C6FB